MTRFKKSWVMGCACACMAPAFMAGGCKTADKDGRPVLAVSIEPQRNMLEQIAGDRFRVVTVMPSGENPETFEPSPAVRVDVEKAKVYFSTGHLVFEDNLLMTLRDKDKFTDVSEDIAPIYGTHHHHSTTEGFLPNDHDGEDDHRHEADPHVWSSVKNAKSMAHVMAARLMEVDPANADEYLDNLKNYNSHLDSLDNAFAAALDSVMPRAFMVWHPSLSYFARDYNLKQYAVSGESKDSSIGEMRNIIDDARANNVKLFISNPSLDNRQAEMIVSSLDADRVVFNGVAYDWEGELKKVVDGLSKQ